MTSSASNKSALWACNPESCLEPRLSSSGQGSIEAKTVIQVFRETVAKYPNEPALQLKRRVNGKLPDNWKVWSWTEYFNDCSRFAKALKKLNISSFKVVNILGFNSPEWLIANNGSILAGCIAAGIYATNTTEACEYISSHSKAELIVVEGNKQLAKYAANKMSSRLSALKAIVVWGETIDESISSQLEGIQVVMFEDFLNLGKDVSDEALSETQAVIKPGNCSTLIYTSGTTGPPKACMISHDNVTWTTKTMMDNYVAMDHTDRVVSYLPLSHIAAQIIDVHVPMYLGCCTYFAQPDALKGSLPKTMKEVQPTYFFGVPRVWEKMQEKMVQMGRESSWVMHSLSDWAKSCGTEHTRAAQFGNEGGASWDYYIANTLVLSKIKHALGLDCAKVCFTAAAPISIDTLNYFGSLDIPVYEVFGQSECTGPHTVGSPGEWKIGTCGRPMPGTESMISPRNKELCYRGRHIFMGYMYMEKKTAETIDENGWLLSGDIAEFDDNNREDVPAPSGFMKIVGRIKDLIITAGGENIPPVLIEDQMKSAMVAISNAVVIGDRRKFLTMLLTLKSVMNAETGIPTDDLAPDSLFIAKQIGSTATTVSVAINDPLWTEYINNNVKVVNAKTTSAAQCVQKWVLLPQDLCEKHGELTPTLKLKRNVVTEKFSEQIEAMYA